MWIGHGYLLAVPRQTPEDCAYTGDIFTAVSGVHDRLLYCFNSGSGGDSVSGEMDTAGFLRVNAGLLGLLCFLQEHASVLPVSVMSQKIPPPSARLLWSTPFSFR